MELGFTHADEEAAEGDNKEEDPAPVRKQNWGSAMAVLLTFSAASAMIQLLVGLFEAKLNVLQYGSKSTGFSAFQ